MVKNIKDVIIYTNNPYVRERLESKVDLSFFDVSMLALLRRVKISISGGFELLSHPLSGSVKPAETPYKSILLSKSKTEDNSLLSLELIDGALERTLSFFATKNLNENSSIDDFKIPKSVLEDFQLIDYTLIYSALESVPGFTQMFAG